MEGWTPPENGKEIIKTGRAVRKSTSIKEDAYDHVTTRAADKVKDLEAKK